MGNKMDMREIIRKLNIETINREVDPSLEASGISKKEPIRQWTAPAKGYPGFRLASNIYSTREFLARCFDVRTNDLMPLISRAMGTPEEYDRTAIPEFYRSVNIEDLPIPKYFKEDGGPYITSGIFHAEYNGNSNVSFHRMMYAGEGKFAVRVVPRHLHRMLVEAASEGNELRAAVSIGSDPASLISGSVSMGYGQDEFRVASGLHLSAWGKPLEVFSPGKGKTLAPAGTEIVIEGRFTGERMPEGPFVDITSTLDRSGLDPGEPVFEAERVLARNDAFMHVLIPGGREHYLMMGLPKEPAIFGAVRRTVPKVNGVRLTEGGCCWLKGVISITPQKQGDAKNAIMAAFAGHPSMKTVVAVNEDIDIFDDAQVEWALATRFQAPEDLLVIDRARGSTLDPSRRQDGTTSKIGFDATLPLRKKEPFLRVDE